MTRMSCRELLLDHLAGTCEKRGRHSETKRFRRSHIEDEIKLGRLLDWNFGRLCSAQNLVHKVGRASVHVRQVSSRGNQTSASTNFRKLCIDPTEFSQSPQISRRNRG